MDRTVSVTGQGSATAVPDTAVVRVAAVHRARSVAAAFAGVSSAVAAIGSAAREHTEEKRVASRDLNVWPAHDNQGRPAGFEARHSVEISCPSLDAASALLEALVDAVGDRLQVEGVSLQVSDTSMLVSAAREAAYADAVVRVTHLATLAGASLGPIVSLVEGSGQAVPMAATEMRAVEADAGFQPGETSVGAFVTASWQLQP